MELSQFYLQIVYCYIEIQLHFVSCILQTCWTHLLILTVFFKFLRIFYIQIYVICKRTWIYFFLFNWMPFLFLPFSLSPSLSFFIFLSLFLSFFFFNLFIYLFIIYFWLCWVFVSVRGLSPVVASGGHSSSRCAGLSLSRPLPLRSTGSRRAGSVVVAHGLSCSAACGIFPDQGSNPCPLHWQADS